MSTGAIERLRTVGSFLDMHLYYPILNFLVEANKSSPNASEFQLAQYHLARKCQMLGEAEKLAPLVGCESDIEAITAAKETAIERWTDLREQSKQLIKQFFNVDEDGAISLRLSMSDIEEQKKLGILSFEQIVRDTGCRKETFVALQKLAHHLFSSGAYDQAADILQFLSSVVGCPVDDATLAWGKLACDTLAGYWDAAERDVKALIQLLDAPTTTTVMRVWLLHWTLFYYFKRGSTQGPASFLDLLMPGDHYRTQEVKPDQKYLHSVQVLAPHLVTYIVAAAVLNKKKRGTLRRVLRVVEQEVYHYACPLTRFLHALMNRSDFAEAHAALSACEAELKSDYFLSDYATAFVNNARSMLYEDYLKIHRTVEIPVAAKRLGITPEQAEIWFVNLIRDAGVDATIDSTQHKITIVQASLHRTVWQQVLDKLESASRR